MCGSGLVDAETGAQLSLYQSDIKQDKWACIDKAVDGLLQQYSYMSVQRALIMTDSQRGAINLNGGHTVHPIGYFGG